MKEERASCYLSMCILSLSSVGKSFEQYEQVCFLSLWNARMCLRIRLYSSNT